MTLSISVSIEVGCTEAAGLEETVSEARSGMKCRYAMKSMPELHW